MYCENVPFVILWRFQLRPINISWSDLELSVSIFSKLFVLGSTVIWDSSETQRFQIKHAMNIYCIGGETKLPFQIEKGEANFYPLRMIASDKSSVHVYRIITQTTLYSVTKWQRT
jgi:hypothetical protein